MGIKLRKSINLGGGFRINLSKSGVGYSWGVPGCRITKTANGKTRKTYSLPRKGISYVDENRERNINKNGKTNVKYTPNSNIIQIDTVQNIESASIEHFKPAEYKELTDRISKIIKLNTVSNILLCFTLLIGISPFFIFPFIGIVLKIVLHTKGKIYLQYTMEDNMADRYKNKMDGWLCLNKCNKIWQVIQAANVSNVKVNAGASRNINRILFRITQERPFYLTSNIDTVQIILKKEKLILLPDKVLIIRGSKVGAVSYKNISIKFSDIRFIENGIVPRDAQIIDYTWQFVNKNGSPDKRYKSNKQLPICLYSQINMKSLEGINIELQCSNIQIVHGFEKTIRK